MFSVDIASLSFVGSLTLSLAPLFNLNSRIATKMRTVDWDCSAGKDLDLITMFQVVEGRQLNTSTIAMIRI